MNLNFCFRDGVRGIIRYRQYPIDYLFDHHDFEDVAQLLIWGHLPLKDEKAEFRAALAESMKPPLAVMNVIKGFP